MTSGLLDSRRIFTVLVQRPHLGFCSTVCVVYHIFPLWHWLGTWTDKQMVWRRGEANSERENWFSASPRLRPFLQPLTLKGVSRSSGRSPYLGSPLPSVVNASNLVNHQGDYGAGERQHYEQGSQTQLFNVVHCANLWHALFPYSLWRVKWGWC